MATVANFRATATETAQQVYTKAADVASTAKAKITEYSTTGVNKAKSGFNTLVELVKSVASKVLEYIYKGIDMVLSKETQDNIKQKASAAKDSVVKFSTDVRDYAVGLFTKPAAQ